MTDNIDLLGILDIDGNPIKSRNLPAILVQLINEGLNRRPEYRPTAMESLSSLVIRN